MLYKPNLCLDSQWEIILNIQFLLKPATGVGVIAYNELDNFYFLLNNLQKYDKYGNENF